MPSVDCLRTSKVVRTPRIRQLEGLFDIAPTERSECRWNVSLPLDERDWSIGLIVGPSGCGKTTLARELFGDAVIGGYKWPADKSIVDGFPATCGIKEITGALSSVGFSSPPSWLRPFNVLSNGEQFRVTMARALLEQPDLVVIDEFTSVVDRTVAQIGSAAIAKAVRRSGAKFVGVACHYDIIDWLQPDWLYDPASNEFQWRSLRRHPSLQLEIARVHRSAWKLFGHHHYLSTDLHRAAKCFCAFLDGRPVAITAVLSQPGKNGGMWREHRTVCLPDFQGVGIGNAMSEYVASVFASHKRYCSATSNPAMIHHRAKSPNWRMSRKPGFTARNSDRSQNGTSAAMRLTAGFTWRGTKRPAEAKRFGLFAFEGATA